jgi:crotonobetainyl-CoA:carnitine CoA-transferase CaiB-like acyl-CoA transferase
VSNEKKGPLDRVRILEVGSMVAGPVAATLLGDFGAEVIKLEQPKGGDPIRQSGPMVEGESLWWNVEGRNKRSVTLDLRKPQGQQILHKLVEHADVLIENLRPGTMAG